MLPSSGTIVSLRRWASQSVLWFLGYRGRAGLLEEECDNISLWPRYELFLAPDDDHVVGETGCVIFAVGASEGKTLTGEQFPMHQSSRFVGILGSWSG